MLPRIVLECCLTSIYTKSIYSHLHLLSCSKLQVNSVGGRLEQRWVPGFLGNREGGELGAAAQICIVERTSPHNGNSDDLAWKISSVNQPIFYYSKA